MKKERADKILFDRGLADSRTKAQALIMAGVVLADEKRVEKASETHAPETVFRIKDSETTLKYVGRGGLKLEKALEHFHICVNEYVCLDVGSSTGGFTDCLLQNGAAKVVAVDSGTNQLVWKLRNDTRVDVRERTNARKLKPDDFETLFDLIVMDVSFISVTMIIPALVHLLKPGAKMVILIKPQFEVGKGEVGKGGIVREPEKHAAVVNKVDQFAIDLGLKGIGIIDSPILGAEGNKEFLAVYEKQ